MHKWLFPILLVMALLLPSSVQAQSSPSLAELEINLWPEYDNPGVLVMYRITLSSQTSLPVDLSFRIPAAAGEPFAVAAPQPEGLPINIAYTRQVSGQWANILFTATTSEIQIEYYDQTLPRSGDQRQFDFTWPADYSVDNLTLVVQQPLDATGMRISPSFGAGATGEDGLVYYNREVGQVNSGQPVEITLEYNKTTDTFSAQSLPVQPSGPIPESGSGSFQLSQNWLLIFGLLGGGLIVGGVLWYLQSGRKPASNPKQRNRGRASTHKVQPASTEDVDIYCHKCGKRGQPGDRFCRSCGTTLRIV
jgi:hypothetical protein